jgi:hypothetical protein
MPVKIRKIILISLIAGLFPCNSKSPTASIEIPSRLTQTDTTNVTSFIAIINGTTSKKRVPLTRNDLAIIDQQIKVAVRDYNSEREKYLTKN